MEIFFLKKDKFLKSDIYFPFIDKNLKSEKRQIERALSRVILNYAVKDFYKIENIDIDYKNKKPYFVNSNICFSISHSNNIVMVGANQTETGLDIEFMKDRNFKKIGEYYKKEFQNKKDFYKFWTNYEAQYKLQGKLKNSLTFEFLDDYMVSITASGEISPVNIYELENTLCLKKLEF